MNQIETSINWNYVLQDFICLELVNQRCGLNEISEVLAGERNDISASVLSSDLLWQPSEVYARDKFTDPSDAMRVLRSATQSTVNAWAATYPSIIHQASGGLDSSIVLGCLAESKESRQVACLNYYTSTQEGDERRFARAAVDRTEFRLIEREMPADTDVFTQLVNDSPILESPTVRIVGIPLERALGQLARELGADAFMTGEGGDHVFLNYNTELAAADYAFHHALSKEFWTIAFNAARLSKKSLWTILASAVPYGFFRRVLDPAAAYFVEPPPFLRQDALAALPNDYDAHPWSNSLKGIPSGKAAQIFFLPKVLDRHPVFGRCEAADVIHPLCSQPVVEACLRSPTYMLTMGGQDRGLARKTFADILPPEILHRTSKGNTSSYAGRLLSDNLPALRELVLDGYLPAADVIDRGALDRFLTLQSIEDITNIRTHLKILGTEVWLRRWDAVKQQRAASRAS
ncbi:MAG: asparagine synthase C-terminal domain-containing protein [Kiloniellales bacterium]|nr:asparagine synthase C-terminal domain-containing protein [Kiloniellales bacterium]